MADVGIRSVYLGVTGGHLRGFNNRGFHWVVAADHEILPEDVTDVFDNTKALNLPAESTFIHTIRQHFLVDGEGGVIDLPTADNYWLNRKNICKPEIGLVTANCPLTVIQSGEARFVVDCKVNPVALVGHVKITSVPKSVMAS